MYITMLTLRSFRLDQVMGHGAGARQEVAEVLGVLAVRLEAGQVEQVVRLERSQAESCVRCRRLVAPPGEELCSRCLAVLETL